MLTAVPDSSECLSVLPDHCAGRFFGSFCAGCESGVWYASAGIFRVERRFRVFSCGGGESRYEGVVADGERQVDSGVAESFAGADDSFLFAAGF